MSESEHSIIKYSKINHLKFYIISIRYRYPHLHNAFELSIILDGTLQLKLNNRILTAHPGDIILLNPNEVHELSCLNGYVTMLSAQISVNFCQEYFPSWKHTVFLTSSVKKALNHTQKKELLDLLFQSALSYWDSFPTSIYHCIGLSCFLIELFFRFIPHRELSDSEIAAEQKNIKRLSRILSFIEQHYAEKNILSRLAEQENVTITYMSHFFHDNFHLSFRNYLNNYRFEKAMQLLTTTNLSILDICISVGFNDYKIFNQLCQQTYHCSAKECRKITLQSGQQQTEQHPLTTQYMFSSEESLNYMSQFQLSKIL